MPVPECVSSLDCTGAKDERGGGNNFTGAMMCMQSASQIITTNISTTPNILTGRMPFLLPNRQ